MLFVALRVLGWLALAMLALAVALALAWLPFNVRDAAPKPLPAELRLPASRVPDERNAAYALEALHAQAGRNPHAVGRALWQVQRARHSASPAHRPVVSDDEHARKLKELMGEPLAVPSGQAWACSSDRGACETEWLAAPDTLVRERAVHRAVSERCEQLVDGPFEFEELLPPGSGPDAPLMALQRWTECSRWFRSGALLALAGGRRDEALAQLRRADQWQRQLWQGSRTLIGQMVATRVARTTYDTMVAAALHDATLADEMAPWLATPPDTREGARRWMQFEANYARGAMDQLADPALRAHAASKDAFVVTGGDALAAVLDSLQARGIGFLPELTKQRMDEAWRQRVEALHKPWPAILAEAAAQHRAQPADSVWTRLRWRNTFGELLLAAAEPAYAGYYARHADHELHREAAALVLALQRQRVPAAQRAEVARTLPGVSEILKARTSWSGDGQTLTVRPWQSETPGGVYDPRRDAITFSWPKWRRTV